MMLSQLITNHKIQKDMSVKNVCSLILALCTITTATKMYCQETAPLKSQIAKEIAYAKEHDPEIKMFLEMNTKLVTTELASILSSVSKIKHVNKQQGMFNKAINKFFFHIFPTPHNKDVFTGGSVVVLEEHQTPKLHALIDELAKAHNIPKPAVFLSTGGKLLNAYTMSLTRGASIIVIGEELIEKTSYEELKAVLAHELAHIKNNHNSKIIAAGFVSTLILPALVMLIYKDLSPLRVEVDAAEGSTSPYTVFLFTSTCASFLWIIAELYIRRSFEKEADLDAIKATNDPQSFINMLTVLEKDYIELFEPFNKAYDYTVDKIKEIETESYIHSWWLKTKASLLKSVMENAKKGALEEDLSDHPSIKSRKAYAQQVLDAQLPHAA